VAAARPPPARRAPSCAARRSSGRTPAPCTRRAARDPARSPRTAGGHTHARGRHREELSELVLHEAGRLAPSARSATAPRTASRCPSRSREAPMTPILLAASLLSALLVAGLPRGAKAQAKTRGSIGGTKTLVDGTRLVGSISPSLTIPRPTEPHRPLCSPPGRQRR
jgi:hypothetical protein